MNLLKEFSTNYPAFWGYLQELWQDGARFLGRPLGVLGGAMTWVSEPNLVAAISNAGGFGVLASGAMPAEHLDQKIQETQEKTTFPFGVNLILMHPKLESLMEVCVARKVSHVVLAGGIPSKSHLRFFQNHNISVIAFAPTHRIAEKLVKLGVGGLIIEGSEAGGHVGPVATSVLAQEILPHVHDVPVFIAGGIGRGEMLLKYLEMGASGCQIGTLFVCAKESIAHPRFKDAFIKASSRDAMLSTQLDARFPVIPVRALGNEGTAAFMEKQREIIARFESGDLTQKEGQMEIEHFWAGTLRRAVIEGDVTTGSLMAGQSVGFVERVAPVTEIINDLFVQAFESHQAKTSRRNRKSA